MAAACPNIKDPVYQEMIKEFGENRAYMVYTRNGNEIPSSMEEARKMYKPDEVIKKGYKDRILSIQTKVLESLTIQRAIYLKRPGGKKYVDEIDELISQLQGGPEIASIINLIKIANNYIYKAKPRMQIIKEKIDQGLEKLSEEQLRNLAAEMNEIKEFLSAFTVLEEIRPLIESSSNIYRVLGDALETQLDIVMMFHDAHNEIVAHWLNKAAERVNSQLSEENKSYRITIDTIKQLLRVAPSDISVWEKLFGAQANSTDPLTGLLAASIKYEAFKADDENQNILSELNKLYSEQSGNKNNPDDFNKQYIREVQSYEKTLDVDNKGNPILDDKGNKQYSYKTVKRKGFHTEFKHDEFFADYRNYKDKLPATLTDKEKQIAKAKWMALNTTLTDTEALINKKRNELSVEEFDKWYYSNTNKIDLVQYADGTTNLDYLPKDRVASINNNKIVLYSGDFLQPIEKYRNHEFTKLMQNPYYNKLYTTYKEANEKLHPSKQLQFGILPQIEKSTFDLLAAGNGKAILTNIKDSFNVNGYDKNYGLQTPSGKKVKHVPIMFTDYMLSDDRLSTDLLQSTLLFSQMANNYDKMSQIEPFISLIGDVLEGNPYFRIETRKVTETNAKGIPLLNSILGTPITKRITESKVNGTLMEFIDKVFYNEREIQSTILNGAISLNKVSNHVLKYSALNSLALNLVSGVNNVLFGQYSNAVEAVAGKYFNKSNLATAQKLYMSNVIELLGDINKGFPTSKLGKLVIKYDAIQGEHKDEYGRNISGTALKKLFNSNAAFFLSKSGEHYIQTSGMLAMMQATKVKLKSGAEINLYDAYNEKGELRSDAIWTKDDQFNFMQKLHKMNKELHGVYNKFDSPTIQRQWYGKLLMLFRKYVYTGFKRRFSKKYFDIEGADVYEGYVSSFFGKLINELKESKYDYILGKNMTPEEARNRRKVYMDILTCMSLLLLIFALTPDDDDDPSWLASFTMLQSRRIVQDIGFYVNPDDFIRLFSTPTIAIGHYKRLIKFGEQLFNPMEEYERKTGIYNKGDLKLEKRFMDVLPFFSRVEDIIDPEQLRSNIYR